MPSKSKTSLKVLQTRLRGLQTTFANMLDFMKNYRDDTALTEVKVRLERVNQLWDRMIDTMEEVESHEESTEKPDSFVKPRIEFENNYYQLKSFLLEKVRESDLANPGTHSLDQTTLPLPTPHVRLPQITLPKFDGKIGEWITFRDLYTSLIHWQRDLPVIEKFHYLRSQLEGEALGVVESLPLTEANYTVAWELLCTHYSNTKILRKRQVQALFELPTLKKESAVELHTLLDSYQKIVKSLDQVTPQASDYKDMLLLHLLSSRLDAATRRSWEELSSTHDVDTVKDLTDFLQRRIRILEALPTKPAEQKVETAASKFPKKAPTVKVNAATKSSGTQSSSAPKCVACSENHLLYTCSQFLKLSAAERDALVRTHSLCRNCFRRGHIARTCTSKFTCKQCQDKHHTLVCFKGKVDTKPATATGTTTAAPAQTEAASEESKAKAAVNVATASTVVSDMPTGSPAGVLLLTALVVLEDDEGHRIHARALLDSGAESNLISKRLTKLLATKAEASTIEVIGIQGLSTKVLGRVKVVVRSRVSDFQRQLELLVLPKLSTQTVPATVDTSGWNLPAGVELADPNFLKGEPIDLVLGAESFFDYFPTGRRMRLGDNLPLLVDSVFGWVIAGRFPVDTPISSVLCDAAVLNRLDELIERFWQYEDVGLESNFSPEEARCEDYFVQTTQRQASGRYTVSLPRNDELLSQLGESRTAAEKRFYQIERRFNREPSLRDQYVSFMEEYETLGHMERVADDAEGEGRCYLPHHPVIKEASTSTKCRVVYDASAQTSTNISLNDCLLAGPIIQSDLRAIILRCRTRPIMVVADVEKMFRQIDVCPTDRRLQSILWRSSPDQPLATYELITVTYGTKPAPFLATRTLLQLATDEADRFPLASAAVKKDVYMDDVITGAEDAATAKELRKQLDEMLISGGMKLRKFASNCETVLEGVPEEDLSIKAADGIHLDPDPMIKTLGLVWMPHSDVFRFQFKTPPLPETPLTRRMVYSIIASLFDPLGLVGPVITRAKIFMQLLWQLVDDQGKKLSWDAPLPTPLEETFRTFYRHLPSLNELRIDRLVIFPPTQTRALQLHVFSDDSEKALGACIYFRTESSTGEIKIALLLAKSRVAPLKTQSIPRLELRGTVLAAEMYTQVKDAIDFSPEVFFWTDSEITLRWLQALPSTWTTFVANRAAKVQTLTEGCHLNHVPGEQNPADLISRGLAPEEIAENEFWWRGPEWLRMSIDHWPKQQIVSADGLEEERRRIVLTSTPTTPSFIQRYTSSFSTYTSMLRRTAYWRRFILNRFVKKLPLQKKDHRPEFVTTAELRGAEIAILRLVQRDAFADELKLLSKGKSVSRTSPLRWYNPFISPCDDLLRVGGRLGKSGECEDVKHPIVLPSQHLFTKLLMTHYHYKLLHAGPQLMLSTARLRFWPLGGRNSARLVCHRCVRCYRTKPKAIQQFMAELPTPRVTPSKPFSNTGVDYFGPVYVRPGYRRAAVKAYVAVFVCFSTKAVHLELVSDLSTARFIQALERFLSRRGKCAKLYSDNGTNFVGARNQLKELLDRLRSKAHNEEMVKFCADHEIEWHFIPPGAPHFGGLWESAVRSAKVHLLKVLGDTVLCYEDMVTLLHKIECCLNSRPLTQLSEDPNDLEPLTPGHFLVLSHLQALPQDDVTNIPIGRLNHFQLVQRCVQVFWKRWRSEYLQQLQARTKWWQKPVDVKVGSLVVIRDENQPPTRWKMARIEMLHPGDDGVVRVVTIRTANGNTTERPVAKICVLPIAVPEDAEKTQDEDQGN